MEFKLRQVFSAKQQLTICIVVLVIALLGVSAEPSFDTSDSDLNKVDLDNNEMDSFWEYYFLAHLEKSVQRLMSKLKESQSISLENDDSNFVQSGREKRKVLGVAGLDNFDVMRKTLEQSRQRQRQRQRSPLMMSMPSMNTRRLRMLMESQGRRK